VYAEYTVQDMLSILLTELIYVEYTVHCISVCGVYWVSRCGVYCSL